jgi:hypothetical protein
VNGIVLLDGQPLAGAVIYYVPSKGPSASGVLDAEGRYELTTYTSGDGAVIGSHNIYLAPLPDENRLAGYTEEDYAAGKLPPAAPANPIPAKYSSPTTSGLTAEIAAGDNQKDLTLSSAE